MPTRLLYLLSLGLLAAASPAAAQHYLQTNLVADEPGKARFTDAHLVNPWGLVATATSPWWAANNGTLTATLYDGNGVARALVVSIPGPPTGTVANAGAGFVVHNGAASGPAR
ncbi:MAG TPA: TIGR03118 family protein, partial [Myxococcales bacterium]|nr:TIGR03118 family protein [Myxococcales bacterium]